MRRPGVPTSPRAPVPVNAADLHGIGPLTVSEGALRLLESHEISSEHQYRLRYERPIWPGGQSGVTVGIGYDVGHHRPAEIVRDWSPRLGRGPADELARASGKFGPRAEPIARSLQHVRIPYEAAQAVWRQTSLPKYARLTAQAFPGVELLPPDAQGALLSLVYNRGSGMSGDSRREMRTIRGLIAAADLPLPVRLAAIAREIRAMKRLWVGKGLPGLLRRRDEEAALVENAEPIAPEPAAPPRPVDTLPPVDVPEPIGSMGWFETFRAAVRARIREAFG